MKVPVPVKMSSGNWFIRMRLGGENINVTAPTKTECIRQAQLVKAEYKAGKREAIAEVRGTLGTALDAYIAERENVLSPLTVRGYVKIRRNRFNGYMDKPISRINYQEMCNAEAGKCGAKTLRNAWMLVQAALKAAGMQVHVTLPQIARSDRPYLMPDQIETFIAAAKGDEAEVAALLGLHSLRLSEICALDWENVDLQTKTITVAGALVPNAQEKFVLKETNKNATSRRVVPILIPRLFDVLQDEQDKSGRVVRCHPNTIRRHINRICAAEGLPLVGAHGLRHSFASLAYHIGMPEMVTMKIGGWADAQTMRKIYTHISQKDIGEYAQKMKIFFENAN